MYGGGRETESATWVETVMVLENRVPWVVGVVCLGVGCLLVGSGYLEGVAWAEGEENDGEIELFDGQSESEDGAGSGSSDAGVSEDRIEIEGSGSVGQLGGESTGASAGQADVGVADGDVGAGTGVVITHGSSGAGGESMPGVSTGALTLEFAKRGSAMLVPVTIHGMEAYAVFDTGATHTTLTPGAAARAEVSPSQNAPTQVAATANGRTKVKFGLIKSLELDGRRHTDVTYGLCEGCKFGAYRGEPIVGLLGLNLLSRYEVTIDSEAGKIRLEPSESFDDRRRDIEPWIKIDDVEGIWPSRTEKTDRTVTFSVTNRSGEYMEELVFGVTCQGKHLAGNEQHRSSVSVGPKATKEASARVPTGECRRPRIELVSGQW